MISHRSSYRFTRDINATYLDATSTLAIIHSMMKSPFIALVVRIFVTATHSL